MTASKTRTTTPKKPTRPKLGKPRDKADYVIGRTREA